MATPSRYPKAGVKWIYLATFLHYIRNLLLLCTLYIVVNFALSRFFELDKPYF